jgi:DNA-binding NtrC family response regulator
MTMTEKNLLQGKKVLIVDDEPDVLDSLEELLYMCETVKVSNFHEAKEQLENHHFDIAVVDIMGVDGFKLLGIANKKEVTTVMLTAHAKSPENIIKSYKEGAASYLPKEKMSNITTFLNDILEAKKIGKDPWWRWLARLANFWRNEFGPNWQHPDKEFWRRLKEL